MFICYMTSPFEIKPSIRIKKFSVYLSATYRNALSRMSMRVAKTSAADSGHRKDSRT